MSMLMTVCKVAKHSRTLYCARAHVVCAHKTHVVTHDTKKRGRNETRPSPRPKLRQLGARRFAGVFRWEFVLLDATRAYVVHTWVRLRPNAPGVVLESRFDPRPSHRRSVVLGRDVLPVFFDAALELLPIPVDELLKGEAARPTPGLG